MFILIILSIQRNISIPGGAEELIRYINKTKPSNIKDLKIIDLYTDKYDKDSPRFNI